MIDMEADKQYVEQLVDEYCGDRIFTLTSEGRRTLCTMFGDVMSEEGIEALTPARVNALIAYTASHPKAA